MSYQTLDLMQLQMRRRNKKEKSKEELARSKAKKENLVSVVRVTPDKVFTAEYWPKDDPRIALSVPSPVLSAVMTVPVALWVDKANVDNTLKYVYMQSCAWYLCA
jgi:hypothetical protein